MKWNKHSQLLVQEPFASNTEWPNRKRTTSLTDHAYEEAQADNLSFNEIFFSVFQGEIIEEYPKDRPYPSCLIYGDTFLGEPVHSVWGYNQANRWAVLITVYRPDSKRWINWRKRRLKDAAV